MRTPPRPSRPSRPSPSSPSSQYSQYSPSLYPASPSPLPRPSRMRAATAHAAPDPAANVRPPTRRRAHRVQK
ncbi:hypothetical protein NW94_07060 [Burkholderia mallei]|nr:hypothetical protein DM57_15685 [Burkholderia mallei]ATD88715.1 hypothetical protein NM78_06735 [Burkholderia mallei]ATD93475.1 hypothetical protein NW91_06740 [Burkholderia mallei]ATD98281.1 hypothetical protein NW92_07075 [Burkholderia mallei]ATE03193.1 hypothetical protein NW93_07360 [Burkholderia mallei]